jgi:hypothetical protein
MSCRDLPLLSPLALSFSQLFHFRGFPGLAIAKRHGFKAVCLDNHPVCSDLQTMVYIIPDSAESLPNTPYPLVLLGVNRQKSHNNCIHVC